jgi:DNA-binding NtrC family response regulator
MIEPAVLLIDDDPTQLRIYGWIMQAAHFRPCSALVTHAGVDYPDAEVAAVVLDYRLASGISPVDIAMQVRSRYPRAPILLLSDVYGLPADIAPHVDDFVRKGEPEKLLTTLKKLISRPPGRTA